MKRARLKPIVGNWAGGESFYDREEQVADLLRLIRDGASVSLLTAASLVEPLTSDQAFALAAAFPDPAEPLRAVLATLEHDGYLGRKSDGWYFPNRLVRAWWADKYGPLHRGSRS